jgi:hypothetical protein
MDPDRPKSIIGFLAAGMKWSCVTILFVFSVWVLVEGIVAYRRHDVWAIVGTTSRGAAIGPIRAITLGISILACLIYYVIIDQNQRAAKHKAANGQK